MSWLDDLLNNAPSAPKGLLAPPDQISPSGLAAPQRFREGGLLDFPQAAATSLLGQAPMPNYAAMLNSVPPAPWNPGLPGAAGQGDRSFGWDRIFKARLAANELLNPASPSSAQPAPDLTQDAANGGQQGWTVQRLDDAPASPRPQPVANFDENTGLIGYSDPPASPRTDGSTALFGVRNGKAIGYAMPLGISQTNGNSIAGGMAGGSERTIASDDLPLVGRGGGTASGQFAANNSPYPSEQDILFGGQRVLSDAYPGGDPTEIDANPQKADVIDFSRLSPAEQQIFYQMKAQNGNVPLDSSGRMSTSTMDSRPRSLNIVTVPSKYGTASGLGAITTPGIYVPIGSRGVPDRSVSTIYLEDRLQSSRMNNQASMQSLTNLQIAQPIKMLRLTKLLKYTLRQVKTIRPPTKGL